MRARYSAFAKGFTDYLLFSWHPATRPQSLHLDPAQRWTALRVLTTNRGGVDDDVGTVAFEADHTSGHGKGTLREVSTFERDDGRWVYVSGTV